MRLPWSRPVMVPVDLRGKPHRMVSTAMRPLDWALPPAAVACEVISALPDGWSQAARGDRRPPLVFVHGVGGGAWMFTEHWLGSAVRRGFPAHALSLRGHGGSSGRERLSVTTLRDYVHDILQFAVTLPEPPVLVGHGMGGLLVQLVLERYPGRAGVVVAPPPLTGRPATDRVSWTRLLLSGRWPVDPDLMFFGLDHATGSAYLRRMERESPLALLELSRPRRIGPLYSPIAVVGGHADAVIAPTEIRQTADAYGVRPMWLPGAGHLAMLDGSSSVGLDIILDWVDAELGTSRAVVRPVPRG